jgi:hypothetical protein
MRAQLFDLEKLHNARVVINMRPSLPDKDIVIEAVRDEPVDDALRPPETQVAVSPVVAQPLPAPLSVVAALVAEPISLVEEQPEVATEEDEKKPRRTGKRRRGRGKPKPSIEEMRASAQEVFPEESYKPTVSETMGVGFKRESSSTWMDTPEPDESPFSESEVDLSEDSLSMASDAQIQDFIPVAAAEEAPLVTAHDNPDAEVGCEHIPYGDDPWARDIPEPARFEFDARSAAEPEVESYPDSPPETHAEEPAAREEVTVADDASVESYVETPEPENIAGSLFDTHDETWDPSEVVVPVSAASVDEAAVVSAESASETPTEIEQEIDAFDASLTAPDPPTEALAAADPVELPVEGTESVVLSETDTAPSDAIPEELPPQTVTLEGESAEESPETTDETPPPKEKGASKPLRRKNLLQGYLPFS